MRALRGRFCRPQCCAGSRSRRDWRRVGGGGLGRRSFFAGSSVTMVSRPFGSWARRAAAAIVARSIGSWRASARPPHARSRSSAIRRCCCVQLKRTRSPISRSAAKSASGSASATSTSARWRAIGARSSCATKAAKQSRPSNADAPARRMVCLAACGRPTASWFMPRWSLALITGTGTGDDNSMTAAPRSPRWVGVRQT